MKQIINPKMLQLMEKKFEVIENNGKVFVCLANETKIALTSEQLKSINVIIVDALNNSLFQLTNIEKEEKKEEEEVSEKEIKSEQKPIPEKKKVVPRQPPKGEIKRRYELIARCYKEGKEWREIMKNLQKEFPECKNNTLRFTLDGWKEKVGLSKKSKPICKYIAENGYKVEDIDATAARFELDPQQVKRLTYEIRTLVGA